MLSLLRLACLILMVVILSACSGGADTPVTSSEPQPTPAPGGDRGQIIGVVRDASGAPLAGARVTLLKGPGSVIEVAGLTNEKGEYAWAGLAAGEWTLSANADGFKQAQATATVTGGKTSRLDFALSRN